jgi:hypothetical protein
MRTGDDATEPGLYASECCTVEKTSRSATASRVVQNAESLCGWENVDEIVPLSGLEKVEHEAA